MGNQKTNNEKEAEAKAEIDAENRAKAEAKNKKVTIKFIKNRTPYVLGDIAGFNKEVAEKYVEDGFAEMY